MMRRRRRRRARQAGGGQAGTGGRGGGPSCGRGGRAGNGERRLRPLARPAERRGVGSWGPRLPRSGRRWPACRPRQAAGTAPGQGSGRSRATAPGKKKKKRKERLMAGAIPLVSPQPPGEVCPPELAGDKVSPGSPRTQGSGEVARGCTLQAGQPEGWAPPPGLWGLATSAWRCRVGGGSCGSAPGRRRRPPLTPWGTGLGGGGG